MPPAGTGRGRARWRGTSSGERPLPPVRPSGAGLPAGEGHAASTARKTPAHHPGRIAPSAAHRSRYFPRAYAGGAEQVSPADRAFTTRPGHDPTPPRTPLLPGGERSVPGHSALRRPGHGGRWRSRRVTMSTPRPVSRVLQAHTQQEGGGFVVRRPFPAPGLVQIDPFLLLDEMGPVEYPPGEAVGAPGPPAPRLRDGHLRARGRLGARGLGGPPRPHRPRRRAVDDRRRGRGALRAARSRASASRADASTASRSGSTFRAGTR